MTSKEKLDYIINTTPYIDQDVQLANNYAKDIGKDLEIVDILKKHYDNNSLALSLTSFIVFAIHKDDEDFNKIKEWLDE